MGRPKGSFRTPTYRKHTASGLAVVTINGQDCYLGPYGTTSSRDKYDRLVGEWLSHGKTLVRRGSPLTITELLAAYLNQRRAESQEQKVLVFRRALSDLRRLYGITPCREFGPLALKALRDYWIGKNVEKWNRKLRRLVPTDEKLSRTTINAYTKAIQRIFRWAAENEIVEGSQVHAVSSVKRLVKGRTSAVERPPVKPADPASVLAVRESGPPMIAAMIELQLHTGARSGEICIIRGCDIDRSGIVWKYRPEHHKTEHHGKTRVIPIGPQAQAIIRDWHREDPAEYLFRPIDAYRMHQFERRRKAKTPLRILENGRAYCERIARTAGRRSMERVLKDHYSPLSYGNAIRQTIKRLNRGRIAAGLAPLKHFHPHQLRHTFATEIRKTHGIDVAQTILGHSSARMTEIYAEADTGKADAAIAQVG